MFAKALFAGLFISVAAISLSHANTSIKPQAIEKVDAERYMGTWYEIARLPNTFQKKCVSDISAQYSLNADQSIRVLNTCRTVKGNLESSEGLAKSVNAGNSKLKVSFLPKGLRWLPFTKGDYWVLRLDENYQTVLVGGASHKYLWVLSRQPNIDEATYQSYLETAKSQGYDISKLIRAPHTP